MFLSIVIPVFNEEESLEKLLGQVHEVVEQRGYETEVIFIDDGSKDASWSVISRLAEAHPDVRAARFRRNYGKAAALEAGFAMARGEFVTTMDADLQDDPAEIPNFLAKLEEGYDVVSGWKRRRHDPWHKVYPSRVFNRLVSKLSGVHLHDHNCGLKCYRGAVVHELPIFGERHRFLPVLAGALGYRVGEIVVNHRKREFGVSKYGFSRFMKGFMDLYSVRFVTQYSQRPQHLMGIWGTYTAVTGLGAFLLAGLGKVLLGIGLFPHNVWLTILNMAFTGVLLLAMVAMILGGVFYAVGMLAELNTAFHQQPDARNFIISETIDRD